MRRAPPITLLGKHWSKYKNTTPAVAPAFSIRQGPACSPGYLRLRFFGASMVPVHSGVPHRQAKDCLTLAVWRSS